MTSFYSKDFVRLINDRSRTGQFISEVHGSNRPMAKVLFVDGLKSIPINQLELVPSTLETPLDKFLNQDFSEPSRLRQVLAHIRLSGRLSDMIYSMESTNTLFFAHQFKPVLKMLSSPTGGLLVADEVGLGKTIEAGLIWTELKARFDYRRMLIICPKVLCQKWQYEMESKFGLEAKIFNSEELLNTLENKLSWARGFVAICGLQSLRPPKDWEDEESERGQRASAKLARFLENAAADEEIFDLVIIDESHHLRNAGTQSSKMAQLIRPVSHNITLLSATPIHLKNQDLFSLLNLVDPDTYYSMDVLEDILEANNPLVEAREKVLSGCSLATLRDLIEDAAGHSLLSETRQFKSVVLEIRTLDEEFGFEDRARLAAQLEKINLLANSVNRTRRRDVQELRVTRNVTAYKVEMDSIERTVYDQITAAIHAYAQEMEKPSGFLLSYAQTHLASCLPAAVHRWRNLYFHDDIEDIEDISAEDKKLETKPLNQLLSEVCQSLPSDILLEENDSKFFKLITVLKNFISEEPNQKIVLFSSVRATLQYLERRLKQNGISSLTIHGDIKDRADVISEFKDNLKVNVLLSSEVGSEGIDLQFSRTVINYDLPWNPMKVEQRIGRVDRMGQESQFVTVVNLLHKNTVDEKIYSRLYERLRLCEEALGGFESVLGEVIAKLTPDLLLGTLNEEQIDNQLEQTRQALQNKKIFETELEDKASSLIAHSDHILESIRNVRQQSRWIEVDDLALYIRDALGKLFVESELEKINGKDKFSLTLSPDCREAYRRWAEVKRINPGQLSISGSPVVCLLGRPVSNEPKNIKVESVTQNHPFVKFLTQKVSEMEAHKLRPAISAKLSVADMREDLSLDEGSYMILAQLWNFGNQTESQKIVYAGFNVESRELINSDQAETLMNAVASNGEFYNPNIEGNIQDVDELHEFSTETILPVFANRFEKESQIRWSEIHDRADIQKRTLERQINSEINVRKKKIERAQARVRTGESDERKFALVKQLTKGQINKLKEKKQNQETKINSQTKMIEEFEDLAVVYLEYTS